MITPALAQAIVFGVLVLALVLFVWGRWRYDVVSLMALLIVTVTGIVPGAEAFAGFGHPAVVTVAAVLVAGRGLQNSGAVDLAVRLLSGVAGHATLQVGALTALVAVCSAFMNNVGALALFLPVAIRIARNNDLSPSLFLMPIAFASLLGGMTTLIGTPPNIVIATFREQTGPEPFRMFDFTPVGVGVAAAGILFIALIGWRLLPRRKGQASREEMFHIEDYIAEVRVPEGSKTAGRTLRDLETGTDGDVVVVGLVRGEHRLPAPSGFETLRTGDILIVEADSETLKNLVDDARLELVGGKDLSGEDALKSDEVSVAEAVVIPGSLIEGRTARNLYLRSRYGMNLLAVARQGQRMRERLSGIRFRAGDVLLLQGRTDALPETLSTLGCLPLAERGLRLGQPRRVVLSTAIFGSALVGSAIGVLPVQIAFVAAAVLMVVAGLLSLREAYDAIDWPVVVLLGAMIPVGLALETTGGAALIADAILQAGRQVPPTVVVAIVLVGTMCLSDAVNNAAAAVLMAPIAVGIARGLGTSADAFLMAVAIGASCAFLTPIGHQSNTLVLGPGGYKFGDYWRMGLPLQIIVLAVAIPLILWFWPLHVEVP
jgi:di/tricarboxylate transporter